VSAELREALMTMEELSVTAAEEIETREKQIAAITEQLSASKDVSYEYEVSTIAIILCVNIQCINVYFPILIVYSSTWYTLLCME
jgi:hypothetical protein